MSSIKQQTHQKLFGRFLRETDHSRSEWRDIKGKEEINQTKKGFRFSLADHHTQRKGTIEEREEENDLLMWILFDIGSLFLHRILHNLKVFHLDGLIQRIERKEQSFWIQKGEDHHIVIILDDQHHEEEGPFSFSTRFV